MCEGAGGEVADGVRRKALSRSSVSPELELNPGITSQALVPGARSPAPARPRHRVLPIELTLGSLFVAAATT